MKQVNPPPAPGQVNVDIAQVMPRLQAKLGELMVQSEIQSSVIESQRFTIERQAVRIKELEEKCSKPSASK